MSNFHHHLPIPLHPAAGSLHDGAVGRRADGSAIEFATARYIEISWARGGVASLTVTRFVRNVEADPIDVTLTLLAPRGPVTRLIASVGERSTYAASESPYATAPVTHRTLGNGAHVVALRGLAPGEEMRVAAEILAPLSMCDGAPRLKLPTTLAGSFDSRRSGTAGSSVLVVSARCGVALLHGCPLGDAPVTLCGDVPLELVFLQAGEDF